MAPRVVPGSSVLGVDVSHFQGSVNWSAVAGAGRSFAFMKATQGTTVTDATLAANLAGSRAAGLYRAPYHFFTNTDPTAQANFFIQTVRNAGYSGHGSGELPPAVDVERTTAGVCPGFTAANVMTFARAVQAAFGRTPVLYTQQSFVNDCLGGTTGLAGLLLWTVDVSQNPPRLAPGYSTYSFWQYGTATVPGITGAVDVDAYNGTAAGIASLATRGADSFGYYNPAAGGTMHVRNALNSDGPWDAQWATNWPAGAIPLIGDWGGDGSDGFGYYNPADGTMHLRNALNSSGPWDFQWSTNWPAGAIPVIGNWDGVGGDGFGYYNPADGTMHVRNALNSSGPWDAQWATNWPAGAIPLIGNWDGVGGDGFGYYNPADGTMHLRNALNSSGPWDFQWSTNWPAGAVPLIGNWGGVGGDGFGYYNPADSTMHLRNALNSSGPWDYQWAANWPAGSVPLTGDWDGK